MCVYFAAGEVSEGVRGEKKKVKTFYTHGESYARSHTLQCYHKAHRPGVVGFLRNNTTCTAHTSLSRGYRLTENQKYLASQYTQAQRFAFVVTVSTAKPFLV